jgi:hypothetical protein
MSEVKTYQINLTEEEILRLEEALYDRASVLYTIGRQLDYKGNKEQSRNLDKRASELEKIATKVAYPIDQEYIKNFNLKK